MIVFANSHKCETEQEWILIFLKLNLLSFTLQKHDLEYSNRRQTSQVNSTMITTTTSIATQQQQSLMVFDNSTACLHL